MMHAMAASWMADAAGRWAPVALDAALKSAALLGLAWMAAPALRRTSAACRQWVWLLALAGLLALPVLSAALPGWNILPPWATVAVDATGAGQTAAQVANETAAGVLPAEVGSVPWAESGALGSPAAAAATEAAGGGTELDGAAPVASASLAEWLLAVWAVGLVLCLARLGLAGVSLWWLKRRSGPLVDADWLELVGSVRGELGLRRRVSVRLSRSRSMPMVWGLVEHVVVLPAEAQHWPPAKRRAVLLHELAHARRGDCLSRLVGRVACALYWFNPLAWAALGRLDREAERACDDRVLLSGCRATDYAAHLVEVAAGSRLGLAVGPAAIAMVESNLEERVHDVLDGRRSRRSLTVYALIAVALLAVVAAVGVSVVRLTKPREAQPVVAESPGGEPGGESAAAVPAEAAPEAVPEEAAPEEPEPAEPAAEASAAGVVAPAGEKLPTTRQEWLARLGDTNPHLNWYSNKISALWRLGLSEAQVRGILAIEDQFAPLLKSTGDAFHAIQTPLLEAAAQAEQDKNDAAAIQANAAYRESRTQMWAAYGHLEEQYLNAVRKILTPEQLKQFDAPPRPGGTWVYPADGKGEPKFIPPPDEGS